MQELFEVGDLVVLPWPYKNDVGIIVSITETMIGISLEILVHDDIVYYRDDEVTRLENITCA